MLFYTPSKIGGVLFRKNLIVNKIWLTSRRGIYCYKDGAFSRDCTMDEMIEFCARFLDDVNRNLPAPMTREQYIASMHGWFPALKRWRK